MSKTSKFIRIASLIFVALLALYIPGTGNFMGSNPIDAQFYVDTLARLFAVFCIFLIYKVITKPEKK